MTDTLRVRAYNVRFGDAILITVPDRDGEGIVTERHILIDVGNVLSGTGGQDELFEPVIRDILEQLGGHPFDLYVMTHEHMDHVQGLLYVDEKVFGPGRSLHDELNTQYAWLTASASETYYATHKSAQKKRLALLDAYQAITNYVKTMPAAEVDPTIAVLLANNNPRSTKDCVTYLRQLAANPPCYVHREVEPQAGVHHPFQEARLEIWAPEEDASVYYGRFQPMALGVVELGADGGKSAIPDVTPPPGVDAGAFYNLLNMRRTYIENLLAIDKAANNTSIVFCLEWRGWRLLFPGDAEKRSWKEMNKRGVLQPVHFLKVSHHGSHNGTPDAELLDQILPLHRPDTRPRYALVSTFQGTYNNVPHDETLKRLHDPQGGGPQRCDELYRIDPKERFIDVKFEG